MWFVKVDPYILMQDPDGLRYPATLVGPFPSQTHAAAWVESIPDPGVQPANATFTAHLVTSPNAVPAVD